jgi:CheY-like chemotaxis protein
MSGPACSRHTILVVEDDPDIAESLCDVLRSEGYDVVTASNGKEGLDRLEEMGRPCLILLDLMMPVMSGGEFLAVLRQTDASQGFVDKPISIDALLEATHKFCVPEARP